MKIYSFWIKARIYYPKWSFTEIIYCTKHIQTFALPCSVEIEAETLFTMQGGLAGASSWYQEFEHSYSERYSPMCHWLEIPPFLYTVVKQQITNMIWLTCRLNVQKLAQIQEILNNIQSEIVAV